MLDKLHIQALELYKTYKSGHITLIEYLELINLIDVKIDKLELKYYYNFINNLVSQRASLKHPH